MAKTINFCGDSFCYFENSDNSWCQQLATKLNARIIGRGKRSSAYEYAIKSFNSSSDYTVFCWTQSGRLYHQDYFVRMGHDVMDFKSRSKSSLLSGMAELFYHYLYDEKYFDEIQHRSLFWFDKTILSKYQGKILHFYNWKNTYEFENGVVSPIILNSERAGREEIFCHFDIETNLMIADHALKLLKE